MKVGLVLGKMAPLHKGHQYLIETARAGVDHLYVLVYEDDGISGVSLTRRAEWIRSLYLDQGITVIEGHGSPTCTGMDERTKATQDTYITGVAAQLPDRITHFYSSEGYGEHVAAALDAVNVVVDRDRIAVPISATRIRNNPEGMCSWMSDIVAADMLPSKPVYKVVLLGAESTGKSTLAARLSEVYSTPLVSEFGREYWIAHHDETGQLSPNQLVDLATQHRAREDAAARQGKSPLFIDTNALTTLVFARHYGGPIAPALSQMADECVSRYDLTILCDTDIPFVQDGTRLDEGARAAFHLAMQADLKARGIRYHLVAGSLDERVEKVRVLLDTRRGVW